MNRSFAEQESGYQEVIIPEYPNPQSAQLIPRVVFDGGNRFLKWFDLNGKPHCIPSVVKELSLAQWKRLKHLDSDSVLIEVEGKRFAIGKLAQQLCGQPVFQNNKCELAPLLALVAIEPQGNSEYLHIVKFSIALPDSLNSKSLSAVGRLENYPSTREFKRNGRYIAYTIREVEPLDETYPAFLYAQQQGFFDFPDQNNAVWDIGGGTSIVRVYTPDGTLIQEAEIILPGTKELAQWIGAELQATYSLDYSPDLSLIMDAIGRGDFLYGTDQLDFFNLYQTAAHQWVEAARSQIRSKWAKYLPQLGEVLVVGGSAHLAEPICLSSGERFKIAPEPQLFNLIAMGNLNG